MHAKKKKKKVRKKSSIMTLHMTLLDYKLIPWRLLANSSAHLCMKEKERDTKITTE